MAGLNRLGNRCCVLYRSRPLRRADPSSRGVLTSACVCVSLSVTKCKNNPLPIKLVGRREQTKYYVIKTIPVTKTSPSLLSPTTATRMKCTTSTAGYSFSLTRKFKTWREIIYANIGTQIKWYIYWVEKYLCIIKIFIYISDVKFLQEVKWSVLSSDPVNSKVYVASVVDERMSVDQERNDTECTKPKNLKRNLYYCYCVIKKEELNQGFATCASENILACWILLINRAQ
jgi:hypothetical protein